MTKHAENAPLRLRWEKKTRYYEAHIEQDLGHELIARHGRRNPFCASLQKWSWRIRRLKILYA